MAAAAQVMAILAMQAGAIPGAAMATAIRAAMLEIPAAATPAMAIQAAEMAVGIRATATLEIPAGAIRQPETQAMAIPAVIRAARPATPETEIRATAIRVAAGADSPDHGGKI
jgi:hypothetical protein